MWQKMLQFDEKTWILFSQNNLPLGATVSKQCRSGGYKSTQGVFGKGSVIETVAR